MLSGGNVLPAEGNVKRSTVENAAGKIYFFPEESANAVRIGRIRLSDGGTGKKILGSDAEIPYLDPVKSPYTALDSSHPVTKCNTARFDFLLIEKHHPTRWSVSPSITVPVTIASRFRSQVIGVHNSIR
jgi:hypothetical protein